MCWLDSERGDVVVVWRRRRENCEASILRQSIELVFVIWKAGIVQRNRGRSDPRWLCYLPMLRSYFTVGYVCPWLPNVPRVPNQTVQLNSLLFFFRSPILCLARGRLREYGYTLLFCYSDSSWYAIDQYSLRLDFSPSSHGERALKKQMRIIYTGFFDRAYSHSFHHSWCAWPWLTV